MITTPAEFDTSTAYERFALNFGLQHLKSTRPKDIVDLRTMVAGISASIHASAFDPAVVLRTFQPLFFGMAWKVIDLIIEFSLHLQGQKSPNGTWQIATKQRELRLGLPGLCVPSVPSGTWNRIAATYDQSVEARHSLVHRQFQVDPASGALTGMKDRNGQPIRDVSAREQLAFCVVAELLAKEAAAPRTITSAELVELECNLDRLSGLHGQGIIGGSSWRDGPLAVVTNARLNNTNWELDVSATLAQVMGIYPGLAEFDLELHYPGAGIAPRRGRLDSAPPGVAIVNPGLPLDWLV